MYDGSHQQEDHGKYVAKVSPQWDLYFDGCSVLTGTTSAPWCWQRGYRLSMFVRVTRGSAQLLDNQRGNDCLLGTKICTLSEYKTLAGVHRGIGKFRPWEASISNTKPGSPDSWHHRFILEKLYSDLNCVVQLWCRSTVLRFVASETTHLWWCEQDHAQ